MVATGKLEAIVIVGPTASGKSRLAMRIAKDFNGEIIAADSRTIYKGMDIGTSKPSIADQAKIKHWGLDIIEPGQLYSAAQFKEDALAAVKDIQARNKLPIIVGGTGLYIDSLIFNFSFVKPHKQAALSKLNVEQLQAIIRERNYTMPRNSKNRLHLINTIERKGKLGTQATKLQNGIVLIGLLPGDQTLKKQISKRTERILEEGLFEEAHRLVETYGKSVIERSAGIAYRAAILLLESKINADEAKEIIQTKEWQYARRQKTWFKRNKFIQWFDTPEAAYTSVKSSLNTQIGT